VSQRVIQAFAAIASAPYYPVCGIRDYTADRDLIVGGGKCGKLQRLPHKIVI
jgi:hypothetical protein